MGGKLIKRNSEWYVLTAEDGSVIASTMKTPHKKLSLKNCEAVANGYDLDELVNKLNTPEGYDQYQYDSGVRKGFELALEILGDKKFSEKELTMLFAYGHQIGMNDVLAIQSQHSPQPMPKPDSDKLRDELIQSLQQNEWDVEIITEPMNLDEIKEQGKGFLNSNTNKPKLDADGCLILKRK